MDNTPKTKDYWFKCPVSAMCGGCQLNRMPYRGQLRWKQERVDALLAPFCKVDPILGMEFPQHYRNKVHAVLAVDKRGTPVSGVYAMGTHKVIPVQHCLIEDSRADRIIQTIVSMLPKHGIRVYNEYTHKGFLKHILIRTGEKTNQIMVVLVVSTKAFHIREAFVEELLAVHPEITTIVMNVNPQQSSMVLGKTDIVLYGKGWMEDELCGKTFRISPQSFYQVNARQCELLYQKAIEFAGLTGREILLDAYCGTGTIGLCASDRAKELIGVELNRDAVRDAKENAERNGVKNAAFFCDDAGKFMVRMAEKHQKVDVVIMDPPRAGSDERFLHSLLKLSPDKVVYVSCNPETLARDLVTLTNGGYRVDRAVPVDMFPCTEHVETVVLLSQLRQKLDDYIDVDVDVAELTGTSAETKATYEKIKKRQ